MGRWGVGHEACVGMCFRSTPYALRPTPYAVCFMSINGTGCMSNIEHFKIRCGSRTLNLGDRTCVMGILNVTPDSFSDGGRFFAREDALRQAERMLEEGADILDVGGESSRPGADPVSEEEEVRRTAPIIEYLATRLDVVLSVDTYKAEVAHRALDAGATMVNDISALRFDPKMARLAARYDVPVVLMHMKGTPKTMQRSPQYGDLMGEIRAFLGERSDAAVREGIPHEQIILDPGIGFGKTVEHNLEILARLDAFRALGCPLLIGPSRKSFIGALLDLPADERLEGTLAAIVCAIWNGAHIVRVHDVREAVRAVRIADAIRRAR